MDERLNQAYESLETPNKRQEFNTEMKYIFEYIKDIKTSLSMETRETQLDDYDKVLNQDWTEDMTLNFFYNNLFKIEKELIDISKKIGNN